MKPSSSCHCGLEASYSACCARYISGDEDAPTPEALMRSRYSAYVEGDIKYIMRTIADDSDEKTDEASTRQWSEMSNWLGLVVHEATGGADDDEGTVEFTAAYEIKGRELKHRERARFGKIDGKWKYLEGDMIKPEPLRRDGPKIGRNDPCPCASGKKYKKCCGR
jgi:SEC-C motif-containing protein